MKEKTSTPTATTRRFFFGTNLLVVVLLAAFVVIAVNWIGHRNNWRWDAAGGLTGARLSDRSAQILQQAGPDLRITAVYSSDEPEYDHRKYLPKVQDLAREIRQHNRQIKVETVHRGEDRANLRNRVQEKFGASAQQYNAVVNDALAAWSEVETTVAPLQAQIEALQRENSWLGGFTPLANIGTLLRRDVENIEQARREVDDLIKGEGLPRYQEANSRIRTINDEVRRHLEDARKWMQDMHKLVQVLQDPNSEFATTSRAKLEELAVLTGELKHAAGDPRDPAVPEDPKPLLQEFARVANRLSQWLVEESGRVGAFARSYPGIEQHPRWFVHMQQGPFTVQLPLPLLLGEGAESLSETALRLRAYLRQDIPLDQLQNLVRQVRQVGQEVSQRMNIWNQSLIALLDEASQLDAQGRDAQFLAQAADGELFQSSLDQLNRISTQITELPSIQLDEIGNRLQQENIIVVEAENDVRVVTFDEAWPLADPHAHQFGMGREDEGAQRRVFAGESAISSAVLSLQQEKPFATVIFVGYETEPSPQMRQFHRGPMTGPIPMDQLTALKERLEQANFKVKEWNMGSEEDAAHPPAPEEGTEAIYVFLPPAPPQQPNFMMPQPTGQSFGDAELERIRGLLADGAKGIFLAVFEPQQGPFAPPPQYPYDRLLREDWGIDVQPAHLVIRGVVDRKEPGKYGVSMESVNTVINSFTDHVIGEPLRTRRVLMNAVCPVARVEPAPEGVQVSTVLEVPQTAHDFWAEPDIGRIIRALRSPDGGTFTKSPDALNPPFPLIVAAENSANNGKVVVMGNGMSFVDPYLTRRVMRLEGRQHRMVTDPPPTENVDLFINTVYWLGGRPELIAAGPADVPVVPALEPERKNRLLLVSVGWAFAALMAGGFVMIVRRK